jgi:rubrerythrin
MNPQEKLEELSEELIEVGERLRGRRGFLKAGMITGAASAYAMLAAHGIAYGADDKKDKKDKKGKGGEMSGGDDVKILNVALGLEYQAIYAYTVGAGTGLLSDDVKKVAVAFMGQHEEHASIEADTVKKLGGTPVARQPKYELGDLSGIKTEADVLKFALGLEVQAAYTYLRVTKDFMNKDLIPVVAGIGANEAQHAALLRYVLKENPVPKAVVQG